MNSSNNTNRSIINEGSRPDNGDDFDSNSDHSDIISEVLGTLQRNEDRLATNQEQATRRTISTRKRSAKHASDSCRTRAKSWPPMTATKTPLIPTVFELAASARSNRIFADRHTELATSHQSNQKDQKEQLAFLHSLILDYDDRLNQEVDEMFGFLGH